MRKLGGGSPGVCSRCGATGGECRCVHNARRHVRRGAVRSTSQLDGAIRHMEDNEPAAFYFRSVHIC